MTFSRLEHIEVRHLTTNQPFCAGVILIHQGNLVVTLHSNGLPAARGKGDTYRVSGVSGGQEPGETVWDCAAREAKEELGTQVQILSSPCSYFHDIDSGQVYEVSCKDSVAPFLLERQSNLYPYTSSRPGLPSGPYTYFGLFLAQAQQGMIQPGNAVQGLLFIPLRLWNLLLQEPTLASVLEQGGHLIEREPLLRTHRLWVHPHESFGVAATLLKNHPELLQSV